MMILFAMIAIFFICLFIKLAVRMAWSLTKLLFGIGAFILSPFLGILVLLGMVGFIGMPAMLVILFVFCLFGYRRA